MVRQYLPRHRFGVSDGCRLQMSILSGAFTANKVSKSALLCLVNVIPLVDAKFIADISMLGAN